MGTNDPNVHEWQDLCGTLHNNCSCKAYLLMQSIQALNLVVSEKKIFLVFLIKSLCQIIRPSGVARMDPRDTAGRIYT